MKFTDREQAGELLAEKLIDYKNNKNMVVVAIPRGGVSVGFRIAIHLNVPLELVLSKKIGHPFNKEYAIGAVTLKSRILSEVEKDVSQEYIDGETKRIRTLLNNRILEYYGRKLPLKLTSKIVILVDDGVATGNTLISSIKLIQQENPAEIIIALPVAPKSTLDKIKRMSNVNKVFCLMVPEYFQAVGQFYEEFYQVSDAEVVRLMKIADENYLFH